MIKITGKRENPTHHIGASLSKKLYLKICVPSIALLVFVFAGRDFRDCKNRDI